ARGDDHVREVVEDRALGREQPHAEAAALLADGGAHAAASSAAFSTASSIPPTRKNASSGRSSCLPSTISLNPRTVSDSGTYLPGRPVNASATWKGCDRKRWILRARATICLSSGESSSIPRIAMMSRSSL